MKSGAQVYVKGSVEAVELYKKAFHLTPDPGMTFLNDDGSYEHVTLLSDGGFFLCVAEDAAGLCSMDIAGGKRPVMTFNVNGLGTREVVDHAYAVLSAEARVNESPDGPDIAYWDASGRAYSFSLLDKFGVHWYVEV